MGAAPPPRLSLLQSIQRCPCIVGSNKPIEFLPRNSILESIDDSFDPFHSLVEHLARIFFAPGAILKLPFGNTGSDCAFLFGKNIVRACFGKTTVASHRFRFHVQLEVLRPSCRSGAASRSRGAVFHKSDTLIASKTTSGNYLFHLRCPLKC